MVGMVIVCGGDGGCVVGIVVVCGGDGGCLW